MNPCKTIPLHLWSIERGLGRDAREHAGCPGAGGSLGWVWQGWRNRKASGSSSWPEGTGVRRPSCRTGDPWGKASPKRSWTLETWCYPEGIHGSPHHLHHLSKCATLCWKCHQEFPVETFREVSLRRIISSELQPTQRNSVWVTSFQMGENQSQAG